MQPCDITLMTPQHWSAVRKIYAAGIASGNATFEQVVPDWEQWDLRHLACCRLVALREGSVVAWAALSPVSAREVYRGVAEVSIYVAPDAQGQRVGARLMSALVSEAERNGIWTLQAGIFPENTASIRLHEQAGFRIVGRRERIGRVNGQWRDTVLMERRSMLVGV